MLSHLEEVTLEVDGAFNDSDLVKGAGTILLVDDEEGVREMAADVLTELGYMVKACANGLDAVEHYRAAWHEIDLVVLDMVMPEMNGPDAFHVMRAINPGVRVVLSSGFSVEGDAAELLAQGALAFIQKPFDLIEFSETIARALEA